MKKSISYRGNAICNCDCCEKSFTECNVIKLANDLQKQYNFTMSLHYDAGWLEHTTKIDTSSPLPFLLKHLNDCAEECRKIQGLQR